MPTVLVTQPTVTQKSPFSSLAVGLAATIANTHFTYPRRDDQAELAWVAWLNCETVYHQTVTHLSTNPAQRRATSLVCPTMLPLSQIATNSQCLNALWMLLSAVSGRSLPGDVVGHVCSWNIDTVWSSVFINCCQLVLWYTLHILLLLL